MSSSDAAGHTAVSRSADGSTLIVSGEVDLAARLDADVVALLPDDSQSPTTVDMGSVTFLDSAGVGLLVNLRQRADAIGIRLDVRNVSPAGRRVLAVAGILDYLGIEPLVEDESAGARG